MKVQRGRKGITLLFLHPRCLIGVGGYAMLRSFYFQKIDMVPIGQEARWTSQLVLTGRENLALS